MEEITKPEENKLLALKADLDRLPDPRSKIVLILSLRKDDLLNKYGKSILSKVQHALLRPGDEHLGELREEILGYICSLKSPEDIHVFFSGILGEAYLGLSGEEKRLQIAHNFYSLFNGMLLEWWSSLPRDSSALEIWYSLAEFFIENSAYVYEVADVYARNINDVRSKKFYDEYVANNNVKDRFNYEVKMITG